MDKPPTSAMRVRSEMRNMEFATKNVSLAFRVSMSNAGCSVRKAMRQMVLSVKNRRPTVEAKAQSRGVRAVINGACFGTHSAPKAIIARAAACAHQTACMEWRMWAKNAPGKPTREAMERA